MIPRDLQRIGGEIYEPVCTASRLIRRVREKNGSGYLRRLILESAK